MTEEEYFVKTATATDNLVAGIPEEHRAKVVPIASTIGKIIARSRWNPEGFSMSLDHGSIMFKAGNAGEVNLSGYNFAYQVKLCLDAITEAGYFE
jgi:hypothetical protein